MRVVIRVAFVAVAVFLGRVTPAVAADPPVKPNILFILSDDQSYPYLSCYGDTNVKTPNIDKLAAEGMKFHRFFTAAPQCVPSRAAFLTGRSPVAARITRFSSPLPRDVITFPEELKEKAGYFVGVCGRTYHLDGSGARGNEELNELLKKHELKTFDKRFDYVKTGNDTVAIEQMAEFLSQKPADKPFCLWLNFSDPHHPWTAKEDEPDPKSLKLPAHFPDLPAMRQDMAKYCGECNRVDRSTGAALKLLEEKGFAKNTLVIFCGDNGEALPHGKGSLYDPGSNVPCVIRWPGVVKPGGDSRVLLSGEDIGPTVLAAAGVEIPKKMTGVNFLPLLRGEQYTPRKHIFIERGPHGSAPVTVNMKSSGYDLGRAVRSDRYKLIYNCTPWIPYGPVDSAGDAGWKQIVEANAAGKLSPELSATYFTTPRPVYELYDLESDPSELKNLSGKPELAAVEHDLRLALAEKMILDFDYLPLPAVGPRSAADTPLGGKKPANGKSDRAALFDKLDADHDGKLSKAEFSANRAPEDAEKWFNLRDTNKDGFISREEFVPGSPKGAEK
jgi:arylsulfatase A-like enzyme